MPKPEFIITTHNLASLLLCFSNWLSPIPNRKPGSNPQHPSPSALSTYSHWVSSVAIFLLQSQQHFLTDHYSTRSYHTCICATVTWITSPTYISSFKFQSHCYQSSFSNITYLKYLSPCQKPHSSPLPKFSISSQTPKLQPTQMTMYFFLKCFIKFIRVTLGIKII